MDPLLLATKVRVPPERQRAVQRDRLTGFLEAKIPGHKLALVAAPAGYGKTTLLVQWAGMSSLPVAWLTLDEQDNDLERFLRYLVAAWERLRPDIRDSPLGVLLDGMSPDTGAVLAVFVNAADAEPGPVAFVLDDYQLITDPSIHEALSFLLDHLPPDTHFVLVSRAEPSLPLARYRARNEMLEFRAEDLSFSLDEGFAFLSGVMGLTLSHDRLAELHAQMEGWIAGLQLVALGLQRGQPMRPTLPIRGRHRFVADYLAEEVLAPLPDDVRRFLLQTSILDRLHGPLCDAVTARTDGQEVLEVLERENLFLIPLDDTREWFRYHRLFAGFLREELVQRQPQIVPELHQRAARWYLAQDLSEEAFRHAVEGQAVELATQILERYFPVKLMTGEIRTARRWLEALPRSWYTSSPPLGLAEAFYLALVGDFDASLHRLDRVEQRLLPVGNVEEQRQLARATSCRCLIACIQNDLARAESYAQRALRHLDDQDVFFQAGIYHSLGDLYRQNGLWPQARSSYERVLDFASDPAARFRRAHIYGALADLDLRRGHLQQAASHWREALSAIEEPESRGHIPLPVAGWVYLRMGEILYEWNRLDEAWEHVSRGLERAELGGDIRSLIAGYLIAGRLALTEGDTQAAAKYLARTQPLIDNAQFSHWLGRFERFRLELWLAQDRLRAAVDWSEQMLHDEGLERRPEGDIAQLAIARVLIVKADRASVDRALSLLEPLLRQAGDEGRAGVQIEGLALRALAYWRLGDRAAGMSALEPALRLAEPEGYVRLFADLGLRMGWLLHEALARGVMPGYVEKLLGAFDTAAASLPPRGEVLLPEPLTDREQEVLELMAAGLTNREIGEALIISPGTVKKHASNIYGKLGVHSRSEAAARARELDLLN